MRWMKQTDGREFAGSSDNAEKANYLRGLNDYETKTEIVARTQIADAMLVACGVAIHDDTVRQIKEFIAGFAHVVKEK